MKGLYDLKLEDKFINHITGKSGFKVHLPPLCVIQRWLR